MDCELKQLSKVVGDVKYNYYYKLTENNYEYGVAYGIEVIRNDIKNDKIINVEKNEVKLVSPNKQKVRSLVNLLFEGEVSPVHLIDIIGEEVDKCVFDF